MPSPEKQKLYNIQAMRGIAASLVVVFHSGREIYDKVPLNLLEKIFNICDFGVDLFFVISGFIMYYVTFSEPAGPRPAINFVLKRLNRVAPMYWIFTTLFIFPLLLTPDVLHRTGSSTDYIISSYAFFPWHRPLDVLTSVSPVFGLGWTLNFEVFFYGVLAVAMAAGVKRKEIFVVLVMIALNIAGRFVTPLQPQLFFWTRSLDLEFAFGVIVAAIFCRPGGASVLSRNTALAMLAAAGVGWLAAGLYLPVHDTIINIRGLTWGICAALIMAAITLCLPLAQKFASPRSAYLQTLGNISFSLYLCHLFVVRMDTFLFKKVGMGGPAFLIPFTVVNLVLAVCVSMILYRWVERPLTRFGEVQLAKFRSPGP